MGVGRRKLLRTMLNIERVSEARPFTEPWYVMPKKPAAVPMADRATTLPSSTRKRNREQGCKKHETARDNGVAGGGGARGGQSWLPKTKINKAHEQDKQHLSRTGLDVRPSPSSSGTRSSMGV